MIGHGGYASEAVVDQIQLLPMPKNMSYEDGAAFTMTYGTSYYALKQRSSYKPGETLLVTGASGGVGLTAVELGALMGLKVIAAVGSDEKMEICRKYGATMFVNYAKEKMRDKVKELTGGNGAVDGRGGSAGMTRVAVAAIAVASLAGLLYTLNRIDDVAVVSTEADNRLPRFTLTAAELTRYDAAGEPALKATAANLEYFDDES
eukprot:gene11629-14798_t